MNQNLSVQDHIRNGISPFEQRFITIEELTDNLKKSDAPLILYGAGATCETILSLLFERRVFPVCITDSDSAKANTTISQIPVLSPEEAIKKAGPNAVCVVAIWSVATFYKGFLSRLEQLGYQTVYFLNNQIRPRSLPPEWVKDVQLHESILLDAVGQMSDEVSRSRFEDFIYSFLSSKVDHCGVLGQYKPLDGELLLNDLVTANQEDILVHCRSGYKADNDRYLHRLKELKEAFLFEPTATGRLKTKEHLHAQNASNVLVYPYLLSNKEEDTSILERILFTRFIDQEQYIAASATAMPLDLLADELRPTILYLDLTEGYLEALQGAQRVLEESKACILISGFRLASEAAAIIRTYPNHRYYMRYFGGLTMRDGYTLILKPN